MLATFTLAASLLTMLLSLWLSLYVVTRSPRSLIAWLTGLTLWTIARLFLDVVLALYPPPLPASDVEWFRLFFPFWRAMTLQEQEITGWLQGWSVITVFMVWHHVTVLMRPGPLTRWRWTRILIGYGVVAAWVIFNTRTSLFFASTTGDPLYLNTLKAGPVFPFFAVFLLLYIGLSVFNLAHSVYTAPAAVLRRQFTILAVATLVGGLSGPLSIAASIFGLPVPVAALAILLGIYVILMGYGVARYSALVAGRTIRRDFVYNAVTVGLVTLLYLLVTWISVRTYRVPAVAFVLVVNLAVVTHALIDVGRQGLDSLFYRRETRRLRQNLRRLTVLAGERASLGENLSLALDSMGSSVRATFGLLVLFENSGLRLAAAYRWRPADLPLAPADVMADDVILLELGQLPPPLAEAVLLLPLYGDTGQLGAVILGRPENGTGYSQADVELLLYLSDRLADTLQALQRETEYLARLAQVAEQDQAGASRYPVHIPVKAVEDALRNLADYAYLGEHPLAETKLVKARLPESVVTHLDRGKAVYAVLAEAVEKLRPGEQLSGASPSRDWYPYLILYRAYFEDKPNRDIMVELYISEGTFNRTRRAALRAVTKTLEEMEAVQ